MTPTAARPRDAATAAGARRAAAAGGSILAVVRRPAGPASPSAVLGVLLRHGSRASSTRGCTASASACCRASSRRPLELRRGQALSERQLVDRLNDLGYAERPRPEKPGEFAVARQHRHAACRAAAPEPARPSAPRSTSRRPVKPGAAAAAGRPRSPRAARRRRRRAARAPDARRAAADVAHDAASARSAGRCALGADPAAHGAGRARHRGPPLLRASRHRSDPHGRRARHQRDAATSRYLVGGSTITQQLVQERLPRRRSCAEPAREVAAAQAAPSSSWRSCSSGARRRTRSSSCT